MKDSIKVGCGILATMALFYALFLSMPWLFALGLKSINAADEWVCGDGLKVVSGECVN